VVIMHFFFGDMQAVSYEKDERINFVNFLGNDCPGNKFHVTEMEKTDLQQALEVFSGCSTASVCWARWRCSISSPFAYFAPGEITARRGKKWHWLQSRSLNIFLEESQSLVFALGFLDSDFIFIIINMDKIIYWY